MTTSAKKHEHNLPSADIATCTRQDSAKMLHGQVAITSAKAIYQIDKVSQKLEKKMLKIKHILWRIDEDPEAIRATKKRGNNYIDV